jgi:hypothetical protein
MAKASDTDDYLQLIRGLQAKCAELSWRSAPDLGEKLPVLILALDVLLSYLERAATCFEGCHGGDHRAEFTGRTVSSCNAALLLMTSGYYDEALSIVRSLGEIANLMAMFVCDMSEFERWKTLDEKARRRDFSPVKVRFWLEQKDGPLVIDEERYGILSRYSIHANPDMLPQDHGPHGKAVTGALDQEAGFLLCLNELARPMAFIGVFSARLIGVPDEIRDVAHSVGRVLIEHIGGITTDFQTRPWFTQSVGPSE